MLKKLLDMKRVQYFGIEDVEKAGLVWSLTDKIHELKYWSRRLANMEHRSYGGAGSQIAILSEELKKMVYTMNEPLKYSLENIIGLLG